MKNTVKYIFIILTALLICVFAGCADINISAVITEDNKVSYTYDVFFEGVTEGHVNYAQLKVYLNKASSHWDDVGFETQISEESDGLRMVSVLENQFETRQEAFAALYSYMTNEVTPFVDVDYEYNQDFYHEDYLLTCHLDLQNLVDDDVYEVYPSLVGDDVDEFFDTTSCTVTVSLPYNDSEESDEITMKEVVTDIPFDAPVEISVSGIINNNEHVRYERDLLAKKAKETKNLIIFGALTLLAIIGLIVLIMVRKKKKASIDADAE